MVEYKDQVTGNCYKDFNSNTFHDDRYRDLSAKGPLISQKSIMDDNSITEIKESKVSYDPRFEINSAQTYFKFWARPVLEFKSDCIKGSKFTSKSELMANIDS